ncbi:MULTISPECIES: hemolysin XhlA family protein [unclassified Sutcliffiella]|uniref:hemolysin XhlA family protein n=1 Tax=unclassified Sutcliffiella TaxID=2837532 RepID=UPI0030CDEFB8
MNRYEQDMVDAKTEIKLLRNEVNDVKLTVAKHDVKIEAINKSINKIEENTTWIKRTIIGAIVTGVITGAIAIFYAVLQN